MLRQRSPSVLFIYNTMLKVYFKYFEGRYIKHGNRVPPDAARYLKEYFIEEQFHKLSYSLDKLENYLLWVFSTHGKMSWQTAFSYIDEYLKVERKAFDISPFSATTFDFVPDCRSLIHTFNALS